LQQATAEVLASEAYLFKNREAIRWLNIRVGGQGGSLYFQGENPSRNAFIDYYLNPLTGGQVLLEVSNAIGKLKRTFSFPTKLGINRVFWDMRYDPTPEQCEAFSSQLVKDLESAMQTATADQRVQLQQLRGPLQQAGKDPGQLRNVAEKMGSILGRGGFGGQAGLTGNPIEAGDFSIKMTVGGKTLTGKIGIREDPLLKGGK